MNTEHYIELPDGEEIEVSVEWDITDCTCSSEYGDSIISEKWSESAAALVTNLDTGETFDMAYDDPKKEWEAAFMAAYLTNRIEP